MSRFDGAGFFFLAKYLCAIIHYPSIYLPIIHPSFIRPLIVLSPLICSVFSLCCFFSPVQFPRRYDLTYPPSCDQCWLILSAALVGSGLFEFLCSPPVCDRLTEGPSSLFEAAFSQRHVAAPFAPAATIFNFSVLCCHGNQGCKIKTTAPGEVVGGGRKKPPGSLCLLT